jgi:two-component system, chemotaxis family, response regulator PixG
MEMLMTIVVEETNQILHDLSLYIERIKLSFFSGRLMVNTPDRERYWVFSFHLGRLNWTGGSNYRQDWWRRHLGPAATRIGSQDMQLLSNCQQPELVTSTLNDLLTIEQIDRKSLREITGKMFEEALFDVIQCSYSLNRTLDYEYFYNTQEAALTGQSLPLLATKPCLDKAQEKWEKWQAAGLAGLPVSLQLQQMDEEYCAALLTVKQKQLLPLIQRGYTLRDIAHATRQPLMGIALELQPLFKKGVVEVSAGIDVLSMIDLISQQPQEEPEPYIFLPDFTDISDDITIHYQPLVACIDDSEIVHYHLGKILTQHGYRLTSVHDPVFTIPSLIIAKPDLIFLDLVMPKMNGYEVCAQIRKTPSLKDTPVIILTGKDGMVDKLRSKLVGANDFLSKPIDPEEVLRMLFYYLPVKV